MLRHEINPDGNPVYFFESDDYVTGDMWGRRDPANTLIPWAYSVSYLPRERTILAYQGGTDETLSVSQDLGLPYDYGVIYGDEITAMRIVSYLRTT